MSLTLDPARLARQQADEEADYFNVGQAYGLLAKEAAAPVAVPVLHGRLIATKSGWVLLTVPNALVRGLFDAMTESGVELPPDSEHGPFSAHISVINARELESIGGPGRIDERGHSFKYQLGPIKVVQPAGWKEMSKVWFVEVSSPELRKLRVSYGLPPLPDGDKPFHITIGVRRKKVLTDGDVTKAAAENDDSENVHNGHPKDVHSDEDDGPVKVRIPLCMQRITITRLSFGKPGGDGDDDNSIEEFMDRIRKRAGEKQAANYVFHGDVQGVGLRKALHQILEEHDHPGLAYNNARTGQTLVSLPGRARSHAPIFQALDKHLKGRGADYSFTPARSREQLQPHKMTDEDVRAFMQTQGLTGHGAKPIEDQRKWLAERWRLKQTPEGLEGSLPPLAIAQLRGEQPVYAEQLTGEGGYGPNPWRKAASLGEMAGNIYAQLPRIRLPDTLLGAGVGALGGLGYDALRGGKPGKDRWKKRLGRTLTGAGVGALGANVVGDRARRYISNTMSPFGYGGDLEVLKPRSLSHLWNAAIMDRPQYKGFAENEMPVPEEDRYAFDTLKNYVVPARREILRRQLGVHTDNPAKDFWTAGPNDQLSINPKNPLAVSAGQRFMGNLNEGLGGIPSEVFNDPAQLIDAMNAGKAGGPMFTSIVGGQKIPYQKLPGGGIDATIHDRWDYTLDPKEHDFFRKNVKNMLSPAWRNAPFDPQEPLSGYFGKGQFRTNADAWKALAARQAFNDIAVYKNPWINQRFRVDPSAGLQMLTPQGSPQGGPITPESNKEFVSHVQ